MQVLVGVMVVGGSPGGWVSRLENVHNFAHLICSKGLKFIYHLPLEHDQYTQTRTRPIPPLNAHPFVTLKYRWVPFAVQTMRR